MGQGGGDTYASRVGGQLFRLLVIGICVVHGAASWSCSGLRRPPPGPLAEGFKDLVEAAGLIVIGRVVNIRLGRTVGEGEARMRFNNVRILVEGRLKGETENSVTVEQAASDGHVFSAEVGPPYREGEHYLLFLVPGEGTGYVSVADGRYLLSAGRVEPIGSGPLADSARGMAEATFVEKIRIVIRESR